MRVQLFRDHLASQLNALPAFSNQEIQSHALTTAALTRKLLEHLSIDTVTIPAASLSSVKTYNLHQVLNAFIHYKAFYPQNLTIEDDPDELVVELYSDRNSAFVDRYRLRLRDYFEVTGKIAHDDLFVLPYLLRKSNTWLHQATRARQAFDTAFLDTLTGLIVDAFDLTIRVKRSRSICLSDSIELPCYKNTALVPLRDKPVWSREDPLTCSELVFGSGTIWAFSPFRPTREDLPEARVYCAMIEVYGSGRGTGTQFFRMPLTSILAAIKAIQKAI